MNRDWSGLLYIGPFVFKRGSTGGPVFESASIEGGKLESDAAYYYITDHLGSTRAVTRLDTYSVDDIVDYYAYGEKFHTSGQRKTRHYSPDLHRWLVPDPRALETPTVSAYAYCNNDPINRIDPDGEFALLTNLIGGVASALVDYTGQVMANFDYKSGYKVSRCGYRRSGE